VPLLRQQAAPRALVVWGAPPQQSAHSSAFEVRVIKFDGDQPEFMTDDDASHTGRPRPSAALFGAALAGLLGAPLAACDSDTSDGDTAKEDAGDISSWEDAGEQPDEGDANSGQGDDASVESDAGAATGPEVLDEVEGDIPFAKLRSDCDARGGYMQVHASCSGSNDCAGFSYGDFSPGVLSEHTCAGANGCAGASCVVLPRDSGKTPEEILFAEELPFGGPQPCWFCHAESEHQPADGSYKKDLTKFKVWVPEGSTRNEQNWLDLSPEEQEVIIAFGRVSTVSAGGQLVTQRSMKGYHKLYSRAEIQRVVQHLRKMTPIIKVITAPK
jgi:hypothetical protein